MRECVVWRVEDISSPMIARCRYDAGSKLQDLRKSAHRAALDFGVTLLIAPKVAQFGALRPCIDLIARVCERAIGIAAVCGGDTGVIAAHGKASAALVRCREYTLQFLATQQVALKKLTSRRLALDENACVRTLFVSLA